MNAISDTLNDALNAIYKADPCWCHQLRAAIAKGATEAEIWHRIDCAKGSQLPERHRAMNAALAVKIKSAKGE